MSSNPAYSSLENILNEALHQASDGKGKERHANDGEHFEDQQICEIARRVQGSPAAGVLFQAVKKIYESGRLPVEAAVRELLGAINYTSAAIMLIREGEATSFDKNCITEKNDNHEYQSQKAETCHKCKGQGEVWVLLPAPHWEQCGICDGKGCIWGGGE